jgi:hypothetical protein
MWDYTVYVGALVRRSKEYFGKHVPLVSPDRPFRFQRAHELRSTRRGEKEKHGLLLRGATSSRAYGQKLTAEIR